MTLPTIETRPSVQYRDILHRMDPIPEQNYKKIISGLVKDDHYKKIKDGRKIVNLLNDFSNIPKRAERFKEHLYAPFLKSYLKQLDKDDEREDIERAINEAYGVIPYNGENYKVEYSFIEEMNLLDYIKGFENVDGLQMSSPEAALDNNVNPLLMHCYIIMINAADVTSLTNSIPSLKTNALSEKFFHENRFYIDRLYNEAARNYLRYIHENNDESIPLNGYKDDDRITARPSDVFLGKRNNPRLVSGLLSSWIMTQPEQMQVMKLYMYCKTHMGAKWANNGNIFFEHCVKPKISHWFNQTTPAIHFSQLSNFWIATKNKRGGNSRRESRGRLPSRGGSSFGQGSQRPTGIQRTTGTHALINQAGGVFSAKPSATDTYAKDVYDKIKFEELWTNINNIIKDSEYKYSKLSDLIPKYEKSEDEPTINGMKIKIETFLVDINQDIIDAYNHLHKYAKASANLAHSRSTRIKTNRKKISELKRNNRDLRKTIRDLNGKIHTLESCEHIGQLFQYNSATVGQDWDKNMMMVI